MAVAKRATTCRCGTCPGCRNRARVAHWQRAHRDLYSAKSARYRERHPMRVTARTMLGNALRDGRVTRPERCQHCGARGPVEGHHSDYSKPLEVTFLCGACHDAVRHG